MLINDISPHIIEISNKTLSETQYLTDIFLYLYYKNYRVRIFQVITVSEFGGAQSIVADLAQYFGKEHEVYILFGGDGEAWEHLGKNIHLIRLCGHRKQVSMKDILLVFKLFYYRLKYKPDVIHLHSSKMGAIGRIIFSPSKIVYTVHGFDSIRKAFRKFLIIEKALKNRAARIVGVSRYDVDCLKEEGINKNVQLVYNGLTDYQKEVIPEGENADIKNKLLDLKSHYSNIVVSISRISPQKKFDLFIDIAKERPEYAFVWIGNKTPVEGVPGNVFCLGEVHSAHQYLKYVDLFLLPTNYEGLPVSILEALSYGIPVVASSVGGIPEILDGNNGFAVENNVPDFLDKIDLVLRVETHQKMKINARDSFLRKFTIEKMIKGYMSIYRSIYIKNNKK